MTPITNFVSSRVLHPLALKTALIFTVMTLSIAAFATSSELATPGFTPDVTPDYANELSGGIGYQSLRAIPQSVSFHNTQVYGPSPSNFIRVINWGRDTVKNIHVFSGSCSSQFQVFDHCYFDLKSGQDCSITIRHAPTRPGFHSCTISIYASGGFSDNVNVQGSAVDNRRRLDQE